MTNNWINFQVPPGKHALISVRQNKGQLVAIRSSGALYPRPQQQQTTVKSQRQLKVNGFPNFCLTPLFVNFYNSITPGGGSRLKENSQLGFRLKLWPFCRFGPNATRSRITSPSTMGTQRGIQYCCVSAGAASPCRSSYQAGQKF